MKLKAFAVLFCLVLLASATRTTASEPSMEKISCSDADGCTWDFDKLVCCKHTGFWPFCFASCSRCADADRDGVCDIDIDFLRLPS